MENLKLTTIRLDRDSLKKADKLVFQMRYYDRSSVIRLALWVGLKIVNSQNIHKLVKIYIEEEDTNDNVDSSDVIRTAGITKDEL